MGKSDILERIATCELKADEAGELVLKDLKLLPLMFEGVTSKNKRIKKLLRKKTNIDAIFSRISIIEIDF